MGRSTKTRKVPDVQQGSLLDVAPVKTKHAVINSVRFDQGNRARLFIGATPLERFLREGSMKWVLRLAALLDEFDWSAFEAAYQPGGRPPLHPKRVVGLVIYGLMLKQTSLRELEALAQRDLGAWWVTGGLMPDFTTITKFLQRHEALLTEDFFRQTTALVVKRLNLTRSDIAIDGTVVQAAASTGSALKREALAQKLEAAKSEGDTERVATLERASVMLEQKQAEREAAGREGEAQVSPVEPEAVLQPKKNSDDFHLAYKPGVAAHPSGVIIGQTLEPHRETDMVPKLLEQHEHVFGAQPARAMADSGFSSIHVLALFARKEIDALIPTGRGTSERSGRNGLFPASAFPWDEEAQAPRCPAGTVMRGGHALQRNKRGQAYREYEGRACRECPLLTRCTTAKTKTRHLKVFEGDELKRAMAQVMAQPAAQNAYRRRAAIVEPVFARLRAAGLSRFRRRGLRGARLEFALACVAHNLRLFLGRTGDVFWALVITRRPGEPWRLSAIALACTQG
jgi:transposase